MKIRNKNANTIANGKVNLPYGVGLVELDSEGIIEINDDEIAQKIVDNSPNWEIVKEDIPSSSDEIKTLKKQLLTMKIEELKDKAAEYELPKKEWGNLSKAKLVDYLIEKSQE